MTSDRPKGYLRCRRVARSSPPLWANESGRWLASNLLVLTFSIAALWMAYQLLRYGAGGFVSQVLNTLGLARANIQ